MSAQEKGLPEEKKLLFSWKSPSRPFKKRDRDFFTTIGAMVFLICVILLFVKEWLFILAIIALTFVVYVLNTVPPEEVEHQITNKGIMTGGIEYLWADLPSFFLTDSNGYKLLQVNCKKRPYGRLILLLNPTDERKVKELLAKYINFLEKPEKNFLDDAAAWLSKKIPLEKES